MKKYISLLRGINVGGHKKVLMADLKELYEDIGFTNVQTYIQSGNVVFEYQKTSKEQLQKVIFDAIKKHYDFEVPNLILTAIEIEKALNDNPFKAIDKMYFTFLSELPSPKNKEKLCSYNFEEEYYEVIGKVIYSHSPKGAGRVKMTHSFIENKLKVSATSRNLRTTTKLLEMVDF